MPTSMYDYEIQHLQQLRPHLADCTVLLKTDGAFPLSAPCRIAAYGNGVRHTIKGGTGSGEVNSPQLCHGGRGSDPRRLHRDQRPLAGRLRRGAYQSPQGFSAPDEGGGPPGRGQCADLRHGPGDAGTRLHPAAGRRRRGCRLCAGPHLRRGQRPHPGQGRHPPDRHRGAGHPGAERAVSAVPAGIERGRRGGPEPGANGAQHSGVVPAGGTPPATCWRICFWGGRCPPAS